MQRFLNHYEKWFRGIELIRAREESYRKIVHAMCHGYGTLILALDKPLRLGVPGHGDVTFIAGLKIESLCLGKDPWISNTPSCPATEAHKPRLSSL